MNKFKSRDLKRIGNGVLALTSKNGEEQLAFVTGAWAADDGKVQAMILRTSLTGKGPSIVYQSRGRVANMTLMKACNEAIAKWSYQGGEFAGEEEELDRQRKKTLKKLLTLWGINDIVGDKTEFEAAFNL
jgi:hypothetical protein